MILLLLVALAFAACQRDAAPLPGPRIAFEETAHDAGPVDAGASVKHAFPFRNEGGRVLCLASLRTACDCRATAAPADALAPGATGSIELTCDGDGGAGPRRHTVTVYSNDAAHPVVTLELHRSGNAEVSASPPRFYFGRARRGERTRRDIRLKVRDAAAAPRSASSESGRVSPSLEHRGSDWRVAVTVSPQAPAGVLHDTIIIETASPAQPRLVVPVVGLVQEDAEGQR